MGIEVRDESRARGEKRKQWLDFRMGWEGNGWEGAGKWRSPEGNRG